MDPFLIEGPAVVSFSGGRTSALMLRRVLDAGLRPDVHVLFANTGKEREETLAFVAECSRRWGVPICWLEYREAEPGFAEVTFETASRQGQPFEALIQRRRFLPNPVTRFCTQELKVRVFKKWMQAQGGYEQWTNVVGLRADEPGRVANLRAGEGRDRWDIAVPLYDAGITRAEVERFWGGAALRPPAPALGGQLRPLLPQGAHQAGAHPPRPARPGRLVGRAGTPDRRDLPRRHRLLRAAAPARSGPARAAARRAYRRD